MQLFEKSSSLHALGFVKIFKIYFKISLSEKKGVR